jgi:hypothetical protein
MRVVLIHMITKGISGCVVLIHGVHRCGTRLATSGVYPAREYKVQLVI